MLLFASKTFLMHSFSISAIDAHQATSIILQPMVEEVLLIESVEKGSFFPHIFPSRKRGGGNTMAHSSLVII